MAMVLAGCSYVAPEPDVDPNRGVVTVIDERHGPIRLVVEAFGSPPLLLRKGVIRICGCELRVTRDGEEEPIHAERHGEIEPDVLIDHTDFDRGILRITMFTSDPRQQDGEDVPFVRTCLTFRPEGRPSVVRDIMLAEGAADDATLEQLVAEILALNARQHDNDEQSEADNAVIKRDLGHLRNAALLRPETILDRLQSLPRLAGDCECQHWQGSYLEEVALLRDIRQEQRNAGRDGATGLR